MMNTMGPEQEIKLRRARALLEKYKVDALLLRRVSSFAWATGGAASYVNTASTEGGASLLITHDDCYLATTNVEAPRLEQEEKLALQGRKFRVADWHDPQASLAQLIIGLKLIVDGCFPGAKDISAEIARMRANLTEHEGQQMKRLGELCAQSMDAAARGVKPGMTEFQIAGLISGETQRRGVQPVVNLVATDDRIFHYRHPLPTDKKLERYALLVLSGRKWGLVCSISRLVHFGPIPSELRVRIEATMQVNAALIGNTCPGRTLGKVFREGKTAYTRAGFPNEWQQHHQGGVVGYEPREYLGMPGSVDKVSIGQALAWNPSIAGAKVEDTILVGAEGNEILTLISGWPVAAVQVSGTEKSVVCPQALEIE
jgi:Xaa-Pro aminopeptidase